MVALKWAASQKFSGADRNNSASLLFTLLCLRYRIDIVDTEWLSSEDNAICNTLSRGGDMVAYGPQYLTASNYYQWIPTDAKTLLFQRCNPRWNDDGSFESFLSVWLSFQEHLIQLDILYQSPSPPPSFNTSLDELLPSIHSVSRRIYACWR
jgi:hypothetical protein